MVAAKRCLAVVVPPAKPAATASAFPIVPAIQPRNATAENCIGTILAIPKKSWPRIAAAIRQIQAIVAAATGFNRKPSKRDAAIMFAPANLFG